MTRKSRGRSSPYKPSKELPIVFSCPNCNKMTMRVKINKKNMTAEIKCSNCLLMDDGYLVSEITMPVDVYGDFVDRVHAMAGGDPSFTKRFAVENKGKPHFKIKQINGILKDLVKASVKKSKKRSKIKRIAGVLGRLLKSSLSS